MRSKLVITAFVLLVLTIASLGVVKADRAEEKTTKVEQGVSDMKLDSIISSKIDYRFTSYDNRFMYDNLVVVDDDNNIVGTLILYTNEKEIDSFYNSKDDWKKTRLYTNLKSGTLRILKKE